MKKKMPEIKQSSFTSDLKNRTQEVDRITLPEVWDRMACWGHDKMEGRYSSFEINGEEFFHLEDVDYIPDEIIAVFWEAERLNAKDVMQSYLDNHCLDKMNNIPEHVMEKLQDALDNAVFCCERKWRKSASVKVAITDQDRKDYRYE